MNQAYIEGQQSNATVQWFMYCWHQSLLCARVKDVQTLFILNTVI
mgnify:FL=1